MARICAASRREESKKTTATNPAKAAAPLAIPASKPTIRGGVAAKATAIFCGGRKIIKAKTATNAQTPARIAAGGACAKIQIPNGEPTAIPMLAARRKRRSISRRAPGNSAQLAAISSNKTSGVATAGAKKNDKPTTQKAENPNPEKPRTIAATATIEAAAVKSTASTAANIERARGVRAYFEIGSDASASRAQ